MVEIDTVSHASCHGAGTSSGFYTTTSDFCIIRRFHDLMPRKGKNIRFADATACQKSYFFFLRIYSASSANTGFAAGGEVLLFLAKKKTVEK